MRVKDVIPYIVIPGFIVVAGLSYFNFAKNNPRGQLALVSGQTGNYCQGYGDDRDYLYNPTITITTKENGTETFTAVRQSDGKIMRQEFSDERFFIDRSSGALNISYDISEQCGGVNVVYTINNPTGQSQNAPHLRIEGITQHSSGDFYLLDPRDSGYLRNIKKPDGSITNIFLGSTGGENTENASQEQYTLTYPNFYYSPTVVAHDDDFAVGSALLYPYLEYKHRIVPQMAKAVSGPQAGTWRHEYREFSPAEYAQFDPGETRTYTISLRFTSPRFWLLTLDPYKKFFKQTYGNVDQVRPQDFRPIYGVGITNNLNFNAVTNRRSFRLDAPYSSLVSDGWQNFVTVFMAEVQSHGFERSMIWSPSGLYSQDVGCPTGFGGQACNYPPSFMDFPQHLTNSAGELDRLNQAGIDLGFWWGRAAAIPEPIGWDPGNLVAADYSNPTHVNYLNSQLILAHERGAKLIGLDAFQSGHVFEKYTRIDAMKAVTNNEILFAHEGSGPDILHRKIANVVYDPQQYIWWTQFNKRDMSGPDVLSRYLNAGAEVWFIHDRVPFCGDSEVEKMSSWGFTSLYYGNCAGFDPVDLPELDLDLTACFDQQDNDNDGNTDWPYDPGCSDPMDNNEYVSNETDPRTAGSGDNGNPDPVQPGDEQDGGGRSGQSRSRQYLLRQIQELLVVLQSLNSQVVLQTYTSPVAPSVVVPVVTPPVGGTAHVNPSPTTPLYERWNTTPGNFNTNLSLGSTGTQVEALQRFLVSRGLLVVTADGFGSYGPLTRDAVARFQYFSGISPADGVFGPETRERVNQF